ncbi:MAG: hypothetical protein C7B45_14930 [Sulfobacillus acidophilus]|uniref:Uncharacterized protein n=1 Tax=Sulfobacillus acidophilus TaxID=53633 RepID=A0A2T2WE11_9FIRM|nr:MAG: hypothetical protein C7B45_14930 [Sulfobacillus acidophilus]
MQGLSDDLEVSAPFFHRATENKGNVFVGIVGGDQKVHAEVQADRLSHIIQGRLDLTFRTLSKSAVSDETFGYPDGI